MEKELLLKAFEIMQSISVDSFKFYLFWPLFVKTALNYMDWIKSNSGFDFVPNASAIIDCNNQRIGNCHKT